VYLQYCVCCNFKLHSKMFFAGYTENNGTRYQIKLTLTSISYIEYKENIE